MLIVVNFFMKEVNKLFVMEEQNRRCQGVTYENKNHNFSFLFSDDYCHFMDKCHPPYLVQPSKGGCREESFICPERYTLFSY